MKKSGGGLESPAATNLVRTPAGGYFEQQPVPHPVPQPLLPQYSAPAA